MDANTVDAFESVGGGEGGGDGKQLKTLRLMKAARETIVADKLPAQPCPRTEPRSLIPDMDSSKISIFPRLCFDFSNNSAPRFF